MADHLNDESAAFEAWWATAYTDNISSIPEHAWNAWQARAALQGKTCTSVPDEVQQLRELAATCYAGLGAECNLPDPWLDALSAAANDEPFSKDGLLPFAPCAPVGPVLSVKRSEWEVLSPEAQAKLLAITGAASRNLQRAQAAADMLDKPLCKQPPAGWTCSRVEGHSGPCASSLIAAQEPKTALDSFIDDVEAAEPERAAFEADAEPMGFDLTRVRLAVPEPWSEYADDSTGHRWGGWLARANGDMSPAGWIAISERMPALGQSVALIDADGWENTGGDLEMNIRACGYFSQMGSVRFWSIRGERATSIDAFTHWLALPELPCAAMKGDQP